MNGIKADISIAYPKCNKEDRPVLQNLTSENAKALQSVVHG
jgi:hypothetical protein